MSTLGKFPGFGMYKLEDHPFLFQGFHTSVNLVIIEYHSQGIYVFCFSNNHSYKFLVNEKLIEDAAAEDRFEAAVQYVKKTQIETFQKPPTDVLYFLDPQE